MSASEPGPTFSIITATLDVARTLPDLLESVRGQTYRSWELLVMDGGSSDGSLEIIEKNLDLVSYWESRPDRGVYHAWNKAILKARGTWLLFLGGDDYLWNERVLQDVAEALASVRDAERVVYGGLMMVHEREGRVEQMARPWSEASEYLPSYMTIPHTATFHHRDLFTQYGLFDDSFKIAGDYEFLLRELLDHPPLFLADVTVAGMRTGGLSSNPRFQRRFAREFWLARHRHGLTLAPKWLPAAPVYPIYSAVYDLWRGLGQPKGFRTLLWKLRNFFRRP